MVYKWKLPGLVNVPAQDAGEELERIMEKNGGKLRPEDVVDESRDEDAVLHGCFEWNDREAAEMYRREQAKKIIRLIVYEDKSDEGSRMTGNVQIVRAFESVSEPHVYKPISVVLGDREETDYVLQQAKRDMMDFVCKYRVYQKLARPVTAVQQLISEMTDDDQVETDDAKEA